MAIFRGDGWYVGNDTAYDSHLWQFTQIERPEWAKTPETEALRAKIKELEDILDDCNESAMGEDI